MQSLSIMHLSPFVAQHADRLHLLSQRMEKGKNESKTGMLGFAGSKKNRKNDEERKKKKPAALFSFP